MTSNNGRLVVRKWITTIGARCIAGTLFFFAFIMGGWVAGVGFHDPDTCWLLAMGKHILATGSVPSSDPFSYTFHALSQDGSVNFNALVNNTTVPNNRIFVPYQWLTELSFFLCYKLAAGYGVLALASSVILGGMFIGPLMLYRKLRCSMVLAALFVILGVVAACFHFIARPEIFSYLFFSVLFYLFIPIRFKVEGNQPFDKRDLLLLIPLSVLMALWCNFHTGFTSGMIVASLLPLILTIEVLFRPKVHKSILVLPWLAFIVMLGATFINPFGVGLWKYIPELFFSPLNHFIRELSAITPKHLTEWTFYPYFILGALSLFFQFRSVRKWKSSGNAPIGCAFSILLPIAVFIAGIKCLRLIPFASLFIVAELAWLLKGDLSAVKEPGRAPTERSTVDGIESSGAPNDTSIAKATDDANNDGASGTTDSTTNSANNSVAAVEDLSTNDRLNAIFSMQGWQAVMLAFSIFGLICITKEAARPVIPASSDAFKAPYKAIAYLSANGLPEGGVLNDAQYGDMMIWYMIARERPILFNDPIEITSVKEKPKVFFDTRFDMYGAPLVTDYNTIVALKPGWHDLVDRYDFRWCFLPAQFAILEKLKKEYSWKEHYSDGTAVILIKPDDASISSKNN
ncbi:MAG: hypothetical protein K2X93_01680 [Candidatus Obscuribacterales bacterium]|nr:hypothetical protein [Candidatus Obscuribacterales bacterium]